jgi:hypothetical protein
MIELVKSLELFWENFKETAWVEALVFEAKVTL